MNKEQFEKGKKIQEEISLLNDYIKSHEKKANEEIVGHEEIAFARGNINNVGFWFCQLPEEFRQGFNKNILLAMNEAINRMKDKVSQLEINFKNL